MGTGTSQPNTPPDPYSYRRHHRRSLMAPVVLITLGVMFLLDQWVPGWGIRHTWPMLLVVIGLVKLFDATQPPRPPEGPRV